MSRKLGLSLMLVTIVSLSACNTVNGAGKDLKSAGSAVSDASGEHKKR